MTIPASLKALLVLLILVTSAPMLAVAQEGDEYDFSDIPVEEDELPYIGVGAGYILHAGFVNWDELNNLAARFGFRTSDQSVEEEFVGPLLLHGGGGWTAIGIIPNVRLGVFGGGGQAEVSRTVESGGERYTRTLRFNSSYTAALVDYAIPVFARFTIAPGLMIGGGSNVITLAQSRAETASFENLFDTAAYAGAGGNLNRQTSISNGHVFLFPQLNFEYALTQFIMIRVGAGYALGTSLSGEDTWVDPQGVEVTGVPDISANGLRLSGGVFLGLFQQ